MEKLLLREKCMCESIKAERNLVNLRNCKKTRVTTGEKARKRVR